MADDRSRLEKLIGMLASDFEGEQLNAIRMIKAMAAKENKTLAELLLSGAPKVQHHTVVYREPEMRPTWTRPERPHDWNPGSKWYQDGRAGDRRQDVRTLLDQLSKISKEPDSHEIFNYNELDFLMNTSFKYDFDWELTDRQRSFARNIIRKWNRNQGEPLI